MMNHLTRRAHITAMTVLPVVLMACIEPVSERQNNQSTNNQTSGTNNQTSGTNNQTSGSNNQTSGTNNHSTNNANNTLDPRLPLIRSAEDLLLHFDFLNQTGSQVPNRVDAFRRLAFTINSGTLDKGWLIDRPSGAIGFVQDDLAPMISASRGITLELRMRFINFDSFELVRLSDNNGNTVFRLLHPSAQGAFSAEWEGVSEVFSNVLQMENTMHLTVTVDDHFVRIYVDGILIEGLASSSSLVDTILNTDNISIGESAGYAQYDTVSVYGRALTAAEVAMHAAAGSDPPISPRLENLWVEHFQDSPTIDDTHRSSDRLTIGPDSERDGLYFDLEFKNANALIRFLTNQAVLPDATQTYAQVRFSTAPRPDGDWSIDFLPMLKPWNPLQTNWTNYDENQPWSVPGGTGDVGPSLGKYEDTGNGNTHPRKYMIDVTDLIETWRTEDNGLLLHVINGRGDISTIRHTPALTILGTADQPTWTTPVVERRASGSNCQFAPDELPPGVKMEVWQGSHLVGVTSGVFLDIPNCTDFNQFSVVFMDVWGNYKLETQVPNR